MILDPFAERQPSAAASAKMTQIREAYSALLAVLNEVCPPKERGPHSREAATAITQLQGSAHWALEAVVVNDSESQVIGDALSPIGTAPASERIGYQYQAVTKNGVISVVRVPKQNLVPILTPEDPPSESSTLRTD